METIFENNMDIEQMDMFTRDNVERFEILDWVFADLKVEDFIVGNGYITHIQRVLCRLNNNKSATLVVNMSLWNDGFNYLHIGLFNIKPSINNHHTTIIQPPSSVYDKVIPKIELDKIGEMLANNVTVNIPQDLIEEILVKIEEISIYNFNTMKKYNNENTI